MALAHEIGRPVAVKIASPDITHKSEVAGVRLGLDGPEQVGAAFDDLIATAARLRPEARLDGVTVEPMAGADGARELLIGLSSDPAFGPVVTFGAGGTMVEVLQDTAVALPPLDRPSARRLIGRTRIARALGSFRNLAPVDMDALEAAIAAISDLALALPEVTSMDINPLFAAPDGVLVVDARMVLRTPGDEARARPLTRPAAQTARGRARPRRPGPPERQAARALSRPSCETSSGSLMLSQVSAILPSSIR